MIDIGTITSTNPKDALQQAMAKLQEQNKDYYWVGIYFLKGDRLFLGPYVGPETDHVEIPVGRGVCGTAVSEDSNQNVADVSQLGNYLACNIHTKSELVVLIKDEASGATLGQIDIDNTRLNGFNDEDEKAIAKLAQQLAPWVKAAAPEYVPT